MNVETLYGCMALVFSVLTKDGGCMQEVRIATILPQNDRRLFSINQVSPAIEGAIDKLMQVNFNRWRYKIRVQYEDSKCSIAEAINKAIEFYTKKEVDVFLGPVCDFAVGPVARQSKFWNIPLISGGSMARDFLVERHNMYPLLTRVGPVNFNSLSYFFIKAFKNNHWLRVKMLYDKEGQDFILNGYCHLAIEALHYDIVANARYIAQDYHRFQNKSDFGELLRSEVGLDYTDAK